MINQCDICDHDIIDQEFFISKSAFNDSMFHIHRDCWNNLVKNSQMFMSLKYSYSLVVQYENEYRGMIEDVNLVFKNYGGEKWKNYKKALEEFNNLVKMLLNKETNINKIN